MERLLGTIITEAGSIGALVHDDTAGSLVMKFAQRGPETIDLPHECPDYDPRDPLHVREWLIAWYGAWYGRHDSWVLCLRPEEALEPGRTEKRLAW